MKNFDVIYSDFDGTITKKDTVNTFFKLYADKKWYEYEKLWQDGKISSKECASNQVELLPKIPQNILEEYINSIEVDDYFLEFYQLLKSKNIKLVILSDGFDLFIKKTLEKLNIIDVEFFANHLIYENEKFKIEFLNHSKSCDIQAGMCKCKKAKEKNFCYIGDGTSDLCIAKKAKKLYAKNTLAIYCNNTDLVYNSFNSFKDIIKDLIN